MIEIQDGFYIQPCHVIAVKQINDKSCNVFLTGHGPTEGFTVDRPAVEVADEVDDELDD
jgi:hypothetical protein